MKKLFFAFVLLLISVFSKADSLFDPGKLYFITCFDLKYGGVEPAVSGDYPLIYNPDATENTSKALWIITEEESEKYSLKNSITGQYIQYASDNSVGKFIEMSDQKNGDLTLFTIGNSKTDGGVTYWNIAPATNPNMFWDRRSYNAVGPYQAQSSNNQFFSFKEQNGNYVKAPTYAYVANKYLASFTLNGVELVYDKSAEIYYFPIPVGQMGSDLKRTVKFVPKKANYTLKIENQDVADGTEFTFTNSTADKAFEIRIMENGAILQTTKLIFTGLPIVQLYTDGNSWNGSFSSGKIKVTENNKILLGELLDADIRYRGATAMSYNKKSFAIKLKNENGESIERSYFGLRNDNYWILDAAAADLGRTRNRVCTDLWNDYSAAPYFKNQEKNMINGTRGQFVEVFLDDQYWGLYCMTERIDRKQLKLKKYQEATRAISGVLYKSIQWSNSVLMKPTGGSVPSFNNASGSWDNYEVKYPDLEERESIDWQPLRDVVYFVATSDNSTFEKEIANQVDLPVWLDYYLFIELIYARDNDGKNAYFYMYDINTERKLGIAPWDLDGTFGRSWDRSKTSAKDGFAEFMKNHGDYHIYRRLNETNAKDYQSLIKKRYDALRFNYFSKESLMKRFDDYLNLFTVSGAKKREESRWNGVNGVSVQLDSEATYINNWISERVDFLNIQYGEPDYTLLNPLKTDFSFVFYPNPVSETLYISDATVNLPVWIYSETGVCLYNDFVQNSSFSINFASYPSGKYFLKIGDKGRMIIKK